MRLAAVEKALTAFVTSEDRTAIALKGPWGRGKTHYWNRFIRRQAETRPTQGYAYVSLFGLTSLADMKRAVAMNARSLAMLAADAPMSYVETALAASAPQRAFSGFAGGRKPYATLLQRFTDVGPILDELLQAEVEDLIVCVDDLERRGDGLRLADVLGYCSHLKERRGCRILVILNEEALSVDDARELARLSEKVFDHRVLFEPQAKESVAVAMPEGESRFAALRGYCEKLGITNIRILQRAKRLVGDFAPYLKNHDASIAQQVARTGALLALCHYDRDGSHPPYSYVREFRDPMWARLSGTSTPSIEQKRWDEQLLAYGFRGIDDLDREVVKYIESGFVDADSLRSLLATRAKELETASRKARFEAAWEALFASFAHDERELLATLEGAILDAGPMVDVTFINASAFIMRRVGMRDEATRIIRSWVESTKLARPEALDMAQLHSTGEVNDRELLDEIAKATKPEHDERTLDQVLDQLLALEAPTPGDLEVLRRGTVDEYLRILRALRGERLTAVLHLLTGGASDGDDQPDAKANALEALRRIATDGPMNEWRVGRYLKL